MSAIFINKTHLPTNQVDVYVLDLQFQGQTFGISSAAATKVHTGNNTLPTRVLLLTIL